MNKKGFTLIELLAVIVILAVIALIATPIVLNMIESARKSASKSSALGFIEAIEYNNGLSDISDEMNLNHKKVTGDNLDISSITVKMKGKKPDSGKVSIENGKVTSAELCYGNYKVTYDNNITTVVKENNCKITGTTNNSNEIGTTNNSNETGSSNNSNESGSSNNSNESGSSNNSNETGSSNNSNESGSSNNSNETETSSTFGGKYVAAASTDKHKGIVYLDPTNLSAKCDAQEVSRNVNTNGTPTGIKTGCMKFYIFDDSNNQYKMILDHNTSGNVQWISNDDYSEAGGETGGDKAAYGSLTANKRLSADTKDWIGNPRLITGEEVSSIAKFGSLRNCYFGNNSYTAYENQTSEQQAVQRSYHWLFDNLYESTNNGGTVSDDNKYPESIDKEKLNVKCYWTSSRASSAGNAFNVSYLGRLNVGNATPAKGNNICGVRPVITVDKDVINK